MDIQKTLRSMEDPEYKTFQAKLMPTVDPDAIIGIRVPALRKLARQLSGTPEAEAFLNELPHRYYEENNLHGFLLEQIRDFDLCVQALDRFLPFVDNWATCDGVNPKVLGKHLEALLPVIVRWMASDHVYTCRYGMGLLMRYYLDGEFRPEYLQWVAEVESQEYYVNMMAAWFFATALAKQYEAALPFLQNRQLSPWVHRKAIQKATESYRITPEQKELLRTLR